MSTLISPETIKEATVVAKQFRRKWLEKYAKKLTNGALVDGLAVHFLLDDEELDYLSNMTDSNVSISDGKIYVKKVAPAFDVMLPHASMTAIKYANIISNAHATVDKEVQTAVLDIKKKFANWLDKTVYPFTTFSTSHTLNWNVVGPAQELFKEKVIADLKSWLYHYGYTNATVDADNGTSPYSPHVYFKLYIGELPSSSSPPPPPFVDDVVKVEIPSVKDVVPTVQPVRKGWFGSWSS